MTDLPWLDYSGQSADQLFALTGSHRADSIVVSFETALERKAETLGLAALSQPERDVLAIEALEREVNNGGYAQFFLNSSNMYAGEIVDALGRIGCSITAAITRRAISALPPGMVNMPDSLSSSMAEDDRDRDTELRECDEAYYASGEDIATLLLQYLQRHRAAVHFD